MDEWSEWPIQYNKSGNETDMDVTIVNYLGEASADETPTDIVSLPS